MILSSLSITYLVGHFSRSLFDGEFALSYLYLVFVGEVGVFTVF